MENITKNNLGLIVTMMNHVNSLVNNEKKSCEKILDNENIDIYKMKTYQHILNDLNIVKFDMDNALKIVKDILSMVKHKD